MKLTLKVVATIPDDVTLSDIAAYIAGAVHAVGNGFGPSSLLPSPHPYEVSCVVENRDTATDD